MSDEEIRKIYCSKKSKQQFFKTLITQAVN